MRNNTVQDCPDTNEHNNSVGCGITTQLLRHSPSTRIPIHGNYTHFTYCERALIIQCNSYSNYNRITPDSCVWGGGSPFVCMLEEAKKRSTNSII